MVWSAVAAVASVIAAVAALVTVRQTIGYRQDEQRQRLVDALVLVINSVENNDKSRFDDGMRQIQRVSALWLVGLGVPISDHVAELLGKSVSPDRALIHATAAYTELLEQARRQRASWAWRLLHSEGEIPRPER